MPDKKRMFTVLGRPILGLLLTCFFILGGTAGLAMAAPVNDNFSAAIVLDNSGPGTVTGTTFGATAEALEPAHHSYPAHHSIWYQWTAPSVAPVDFTTPGSSFDTVLAIYTGASVSTLTPIVKNDDDQYGSYLSSRASLVPVAGTTYYIALDGYNTYFGDCVLSWGPPPPTITISGTVHLPAPAPAGGLVVDMHAVSANEMAESSVSVTIAEGALSAPYSIHVLQIAGMQWLVYYDYSGSAAYVYEGFYNATATSWKQEQATLLAGGSAHANIDLTLLAARTISGTVSLPSGVAASNMGLQLSAFYNEAGASCPSSSLVTYGHSSSQTIVAGTSSVAYELRVPPDTAWGVRYAISNLYAPYGYYNSTATTWDAGQATMLPQTGNQADIDLTLLPGRMLSGRVLLPPGQVAPVGGISVGMFVSDENYGPVSQNKYVTILAGGNASAVYTFYLPPDPAAKWRVRYQLQTGNIPYVPVGYYNATATTWEEMQATLLPGGAVDYADIDVTCIPGKVISGTVSLESPAISNTSFYVTAANANQSEVSYTASGSISAGAMSGLYTLVVPDDAAAQWRVSATEGYVNYYYSTTDTTWNSALATLLPGGADHSAINMTLSQVFKTISGRVLLPVGMVAPIEGMTVRVFAAADNGTTVEEAQAYFPAGTSAAEYRLYLPLADTQWLVKYENYMDMCQGDPRKISEGYYSTTGTMGLSQATPLSGNENHSGINLTLLRTELFNWNIFLPAVVSHK